MFVGILLDAHAVHCVLHFFTTTRRQILCILPYPRAILFRGEGLPIFHHAESCTRQNFHRESEYSSFKGECW